MRKFFLLFFVIVGGCGGGKLPPVTAERKKPFLTPTLLSGGSYEQVIDYLLNHLKESGLPLQSLPPYYRSRAVALPTYLLENGVLILPYPAWSVYRRWLEKLEVFEKIDCNNNILTFLMNYMLLVETGHLLRVLWKLSDRSHPEQEEHLSQMFAECVVESMTEREPDIEEESVVVFHFLDSLLSRAKLPFAQLGYEALLKWYGENRAEFRQGTTSLAALRLCLMRERIRERDTPLRTSDWIRTSIIEPAKKIKEKLIFSTPSLSVRTIYEGQEPVLTPNLRVYPQLASVGFDGDGRLLFSNFKNVYQWRRRGILRLISGEQAAFSPTSFAFLDRRLVFADGNILRFVDLEERTVRNVDISDYLKPPSTTYNYGIVPICVSETRIYIADNTRRKVLVFDELGNYIKGLDTDGLVGGIAFMDGRLYITLTNRHTVEYYDNTAGRFITVAGVRDFEGHADGAGVSALFKEPMGMAVLNGSLIIADKGNHAIRRITPDGNVTTISGFAGGKLDASVTDAQFFFPVSVAVSGTSEIAVGEITTGRIRIISKKQIGIAERTYKKPDIVTPINDPEVRRLTDVIRRAPLGYQLYSSYCKRGIRLAELKQYDEAISDIKRAILIIPFNIEARLCKGDIYLMQGRIEEAVDAYTEAIGVKERLSIAERCADPLYIKAYYLRALANLRRNDEDRALEDVEKALSYRSHSTYVLHYPDVETGFLTDMLTLKGKILLRKGKFNEAEVVLSDAIKRKRGLKEALLFRGIVRIKLKKPREAMNDLKQAMILDVRWAEPLYWLGRLYEETYDDPKKAIEYYTTHIILGGRHKTDSEGRIEQLKKVLSGKTESGTGGYTEEIIEDDEGRRWILRRYTNGKVEKIPLEEK